MRHLAKSFSFSFLFCVLVLTVEEPARSDETHLSSVDKWADSTREGELLGQAKEWLENHYPAWTVTAVELSPIPGLFQTNVKGKPAYFALHSDAIIFGRIWNSEGKELSRDALIRYGKLEEEAVFKQARTWLEQNPVETSVVINMTDKPTETLLEIVELSNPDCGYCHRLQAYYDDKNDIPYVRKIILSVPPLPAVDEMGDFVRSPSQSSLKALHILCSADPGAEMQKFLRGKYRPNEFRDCRDGREELSRHATQSAGLGLRGTPYAIVGNVPVRGFNPKAYDAIFETGEGR